MMAHRCVVMCLVAAVGVRALGKQPVPSMQRAHSQPPEASTTSSYRLFAATCGVSELEPMLLAVVRPAGQRRGGAVTPTATLKPFGPVVGAVGSASKWVVQNPLHKNILVSSRVHSLQWHAPTGQPQPAWRLHEPSYISFYTWRTHTLWPDA